MGKKTYAVVVPWKRKDQDYSFLSFEDLHDMPFPSFHEEPVLYTKEEAFEVVKCINRILKKDM